MDIHRCRFVAYQPPFINALAFSHQSDTSRKAPAELRLAVGREGGDIEIWNPQGGNWVQESILRGSSGQTVEQIAWTQDVEVEDQGGRSLARPGQLRLFSIGGSTSITEWSLVTGAPKKHADGNFGDIWCLAAQPSSKLAKDDAVDGGIPAQLLAAGCGDGNAILFSTEDRDLRFSQLLIPSPEKKSKVLSIAWRDRSTVVAGYEDSTIRIIDLRTRTTLRTMTLGKTPTGTKSVVWTLKSLPDGTILSGDSSGELKIWDAKTLSLAQRLKTHQADILDIASNVSGDQIFTVGVDRRTVAYRQLPAQPDSKKRKWTQAMHRRFHKHDVKAAASFESKGVSVLVTGGVDSAPLVLPLRNWTSEYHRGLSHLPHGQQISAAPIARLFITYWQNQIQVYHIARRSPNGNLSGDGALPRRDYDMLANLRMKGEEHLQSAEISRDGSLIIACTSAGVRLLQIRKTISNGRFLLRSRPVTLPPTLHQYGALRVGFSPNGHWLYAIKSGATVVLIKVTADLDPKRPPGFRTKVVRLSHQSSWSEDSALGEYQNRIATIAFSSDSRCLAVGDLSGSITSWILEGHEDRLAVDESSSSGSSSGSDSESDSDDEDESPVIHGQKWIRCPASASFPRLDSAILILTFRPQTEQQHQSTSSLTNTNRGLHATRHNPHPVAHELPSPPKLVAVTATHQVAELEVNTGRLTDWSRRNPSSQLPPILRQIKDRAMGAFWDCSTIASKGERLFLYGTSWIYMLDMSTDLPEAYKVERDDWQSQAKKRKRGTGAGDELKPQDRTAGYGSFGVTYKGQEAMQLVGLDRRMSPASDGEDPGSIEALVRLRRAAKEDGEVLAGVAQQKGSVGGEDIEMKDRNDTAEDKADEGVGSAPSDVKTQKKKHNKSRKHEQVQSMPKRRMAGQWHTFRYRSIFGIVVMNDPHSPSYDTDQGFSTGIEGSDVQAEAPGANGSADANALEIVVVERPMHDVELPPRFDGGRDWET